MKRNAIPVGIIVAGAIGCGADHERNRTQKKKRNDPKNDLGSDDARADDVSGGPSGGCGQKTVIVHT